MGLSAIIRSGLTIAKTVTADLQADVVHRAFIQSDEYAEPSYALKVTRKALVQRAVKRFLTTTGDEVLSTHRITFLEPVDIDARDELSVNGSQAAILSISSVVDPTTSDGYYADVYVGIA